MQLSQIILPEAIVPELSSTTKEDAILQLIEILVASRGLDPSLKREITIGLLKRESTKTTAVENGIAIPHAKVTCVKDFFGALGLCRNGVDFDSPDGKPVHVIFLFLSPKNKPEQHLKIMALVSRLLTTPDFIGKLRSAPGRE